MHYLLNEWDMFVWTGHRVAKNLMSEINKYEVFIARCFFDMKLNSMACIPVNSFIRYTSVYCCTLWMFTNYTFIYQQNCI